MLFLLTRGELVTLHQDAFGLPDQVPAVDGLGELGLLPDAGIGDGGVGGEEQPDLFGLVVEGVGCAAVRRLEQKPDRAARQSTSANGPAHSLES